jgi:hypothetical protein
MEDNMSKIAQVLSRVAVIVILVLWVGATAFAQTATTASKKVRGAPGPIAGAGLSIVVVGFGAYWLVQRYRRKSS